MEIELDDKVLNEMKEIHPYLQYTFFINAVKPNNAIELTIGSIDSIFDSVWNDLKHYFIKYSHFGFDSINMKHITPTWDKDEKRSNYRASYANITLSQHLFKEICISYAIIKIKELLFRNTDVDIATEIREINQNGELHVCDKIKDKKNIDKVNLHDSYNISKSTVNNTTPPPNDRVVNNHIKNMKKRATTLYGNSQNFTPALPFKKGKNDKGIRTTRDQTTFAFTLISGDSHAANSFHKSLNNLPNHFNNDQSTHSKIIECFRRHIKMATYFKSLPLKSSITDKNYSLDNLLDGASSPKNISLEQNSVDIMLVNDSIESTYHISLLFELLKLRKTIYANLNFPFEENVLDDLLIRSSDIKMPFIRNLYLEDAVKAQKYTYFLEGVHEDDMITMISRKYRRALDKRKQQLVWSDSFARYIDQLTYIFTPLITSSFLLSLYNLPFCLDDDKLTKNSETILELLEKYTFNKILKPNNNKNEDGSFKDSTLKDLKGLSAYNYLYGNFKYIEKIKSELEDFQITDITIDSTDVKFIYDFYQYAFKKKGLQNISEDIFTLIEKVNNNDINSMHLSINNNYKENKSRQNLEAISTFLKQERETITFLENMANESWSPSYCDLISKLFYENIVQPLLEYEIKPVNSEKVLFTLESFISILTADATTIEKNINQNVKSNSQLITDSTLNALYEIMYKDK